MKKTRPTSERVYRELTTHEQDRLEAARRDSEANRETIIAWGRQQKLARVAMSSQIQELVSSLKKQREQLGLSLADIEAKTGIKKSALSRLENNSTANPTLLTLYRYSMALGLSFTASAIRPK